MTTRHLDAFTVFYYDSTSSNGSVHRLPVSVPKTITLAIFVMSRSVAAATATEHQTLPKMDVLSTAANNPTRTVTH